VPEGGRVGEAGMMAPDWYEDAIKRVDSYAEYRDGWRGEGTLAPTPKILRETKKLLRTMISSIPNLPRPGIGFDEDGCGCLSWNRIDLLATLSTYGDGTFSFYARNATTNASADSHKVSSLPRKLSALFAEALA
jgi:hypothetical protein